MARNLRPPPRANPELFSGAPRGVQEMREPKGMVGEDRTPAKSGPAGNTGATPQSTAKSVMADDPTKISPRGKEIQENPPFEDPLFNQMVQEEMRRIEAELQAELDTQSQLLEGGSISPEGKQLAAHLAGTAPAPAGEEDVHPYAIREGIANMRNHSPTGGAPPPKYGLADDNNDPDYNTKILQPPAPASPARSGAGDSPINLKNWKREGYPSEYAYAMAMGELDKRPKQEVKSVAEVGVREEKSWEQLLSPARKKGQGGLSSLQAQQHEEKRKAQERYNQQLHEDRLMEERRKQAEAAGVDQQPPPRGRAPAPGRGDFDLSGYVDDQVRQEGGSSDVAPSQGVYGVTANTEKAMKRAKQEEYRRQLDAEGGGAPAAPAARRRERSLDPPNEASLPTQAAGAGVPPDGFVSSVKVAGAAQQQSFSENEVDASKAAKKKQQLEYRHALEVQMQEAKAAKEKYKAEKEEEDRELLEAAAILQNQPRAMDAPGKEASNMNINSFEPSSGNMMVMEYNLAKTRKTAAPKSPIKGGQADFAAAGVPPELELDKYPASSSGGAPPALDLDANEISSPGKARQRLISDVYGSSTITAHELQGYPQASTWRPGGRNSDERKVAAMNEQKAILLKQMEEVRQRKEQEKDKARQEDMEDERRVRAELQELAKQQGLNPMAAPGQNPASPTRRYGNPVGNNSSQMGSQLGSQVGDTSLHIDTEVRGAGGSELNEGYNTRVKRLSPDQRAKLQETMQNNYLPLEPLPSKAVQRQRAHQAQARAPPRQFRSPPRAGLPSGAPSKENPTPGSPRLGGGVEFVQAVQERALNMNMNTGAYDMPGGDSLDAQSSFHSNSQVSRSVYDSYEGIALRPTYGQATGVSGAQPSGGAAQHGIDHFRPTSAEEVDSFLVNWQRQINMPQPRSGFAIPLVPPKEGVHHYQQPAHLRGSMDSAMSKHSRHSQHLRASHESTTGDVSFVSDSRLIPSNPWDPSGLLAALGPGNPITGPGQVPLVEQGQASSTLANVGKAALGLDGPREAGEFHLPSERGKLQATHLAGVGTAAAQMEKSLTSDSLLMYLGSRTPVNPNNLGVDQALRDAHKNPFAVDGSQATNPFGSPDGRASEESASVQVFEEAAQGPESPLTKLVKAHSRPNTGGSAHGRKSSSPPKFKLESEGTEEDEILVIPSPNTSPMAAKQPTPDRMAHSPVQARSSSGHASPVAFQVHHSPPKSSSTSPEQQQQQLQLQQQHEQQQAAQTGAQGVEGEVVGEEEYADEAYDDDDEEDDGILPSHDPALPSGEMEGKEAGEASTGFKKWEPATKEGTHSSEALLDAALGLGDGTDGADGEGQVVDEEETNMYADDYDEPGVSVSADANISNIPTDAALTSSAMNYEDDYEDDEDFGDGAGGGGSFSVKVLITEGRGIGPAKFVAFEEEGNGPEPFVVLSVANRNYASDRAVGTDPVWQQTVDLDWDGFSLIHVQCMDQNEVETEDLGDKHLDLSILGLDYGVPMPVELPLENGYHEGAALFLEVTLNAPA